LYKVSMQPKNIGNHSAHPSGPETMLELQLNTAPWQPVFFTPTPWDRDVAPGDQGISRVRNPCFK
jgi:hypothetical protein